MTIAVTCADKKPFTLHDDCCSDADSQPDELRTLIQFYWYTQVIVGNRYSCALPHPLGLVFCAYLLGSISTEADNRRLRTASHGTAINLLEKSRKILFNKRNECTHLTVCLSVENSVHFSENQISAISYYPY